MWPSFWLKWLRKYVVLFFLPFPVLHSNWLMMRFLCCTAWFWEEPARFMSCQTKTKLKVAQGDTHSLWIHKFWNFFFRNAHQHMDLRSQPHICVTFVPQNLGGMVNFPWLHFHYSKSRIPALPCGKMHSSLTWVQIIQTKSLHLRTGCWLGPNGSYFPWRSALVRFFSSHVKE